MRNELRAASVGGVSVSVSGAHGAELYHRAIPLGFLCRLTGPANFPVGPFWAAQADQCDGCLAS